AQRPAHAGPEIVRGALRELPSLRRRRRQRRTRTRRAVGVRPERFCVARMAGGFARSGTRRDDELLRRYEVSERPDGEVREERRGRVSAGTEGEAAETDRRA